MILEPISRAFAALAQRADTQIDLTEGAILIAALYSPQLDRRAEAARIDSLAAEAAAALAGGAGRTRALALAHWLFVEQGFAGNHLNYYDPRNSFLPEVLTRRLGIPIALAVLYLEVARRVGQPAFGVPLPGHFVIGAPVEGGTIYLNPFGGEELPRHALEALAARAVGRPVRIDGFLRPASRRAILVRMLQNLKQIYLSRESWELALRAIDWILLLTPESLLDRRDRGLLAFRLGQYGDAIAHLRRYLQAAPAGAERDRISRLLASLAS
ncbi:MAG: tetratricopeptide repeat protein [Chloroflexota bacterium]|nr:tetratricopeptide repeat protein [Dehalococcoidia bacterium]MDW8253350.1 tetratricopeptide repeat protein [Chloroflexota bacterium]